MFIKNQFCAVEPFYCFIENTLSLSSHITDGSLEGIEKIKNIQSINLYSKSFPAVALILSFFFYATFANAQLCTGSFGDPVVNITFGAGFNPGPPLPATTTNYKYVSDPCPVNGYYSLLNRGINCNYGWHVLTSDHTGDPNGYFMLADASFEPGDFYVDTVKTLCPNTTYEFAAWMLNMKNITQGIRPNITFRIETANGTVLKTYNSGDIPVEQTITWRQYGFYFTTPADVSIIVLRITNTAQGGDGNDLALDDITFRPCGPTITATVNGSRDTVHICEGDTDVFNFTGNASSAYVNPVYQWQLSIDSGKTWKDIQGAVAASYQRQPTGASSYWYRFTVTDQTTAGIKSCRIASNNITIIVHKKPLVSAGPDRVILKNDTLHITGSVSGDNPSFSWSPVDGLENSNQLTPAASPLSDMSYTLSAISQFGCSNEDAMTIKVLPGIFIPTAFTPDNDGKNDLWRISLPDQIGAEVNVYNRWGQLIYHASGSTISWDGTFKGKLQPTGTYVFQVQLKKQGHQVKGTFTLIR